MSRLRRNLLFSAFGVALALVLAALYAQHRWAAFQRAEHIETLELDGLRLSTNGIALRQLVLVQARPDGARLQLELDDVRVGLAAQWRPLPLQSLVIASARIAWQPPTQPPETADPPALPEPDAWRRMVAWIPREGRIDRLQVELPCPSGRCQEHGRLDWQHAGSDGLPASLQLVLERGDNQLGLVAQARADASAPSHDTLLDLELQFDGQPRLTMQNRFEPQSGKTRWLGSLSLTELPEAPWLLTWLGDWLPEPPPPLPTLPEQMRVGAGWDVVLDHDTLLQDRTAVNGNLRLSANLPTPWPVLGLGQVQGQLDLSATAADGTWLPLDLAADLSLRPDAAHTAILPPALRPAALSLKITPASPNAAAALPLDLQLAASGPAPFSLDGRVTLQTAAPYTASFDALRLVLRSPSVQGPDIDLNAVAADLRLGGSLTPETAAIQLGKGSRVTVGNLRAASAELSASAVALDLAGTTFDATFAGGAASPFSLTGKPAITLSELKHPNLRTQGWRWNGTLEGNNNRIALAGPLANDAGLTLPLTLTHDLAAGATQLDARLPELFLRAGNPLSTTLADWPSVLTLGTGRLQGQVTLQTAPGRTPAATATFSAKGVGGIYDRTELSGLDAQATLTLSNDVLRVDLPELTLREANPGFTFGPLRLDGSFSGPLENLAQGRVSWRLAELMLLGGRLWLEPGVADLAAATQRIDAHLRGLQLPALLEAYPAEGLTGTGVIDGELQLQRSDAGISIEQGSLNAREPGGALQFRSAKIQALGQSNPAMRLVTEALDDFHYDLLTGDVHYAASGALTLGLKLHGRNPALEGGRPINFSINLEEDIPALLTSLQLSDRVSETIQRRVQERLGQERK
ncbi:YdbH domain-containing protein [Stutzerimonas chloritidismutans]|uniref:YdbH domain-containing protein n=1 Tax=Stutzerimonas chloritidismutans TaxID=203192 RepID=UPI003F1900F4